MQDYSDAQLWGMHPDRFQALLLDFQKKAVQRPTVEFVRDYKKMEDIAQRKSLAFSNVASYVQQTDGALNIEKDFPSGNHGRAAYQAMKFEDVTGKLAAEKDRFGLIYVTGKNCQICNAQQVVVTALQNKYGWLVKTLDRDDNPGLVGQLGLTSVPAILVAPRDKKVPELVAYGSLALDDLETRLYRSIRMSLGETKPENYSTYEFQRGGAFDPTNSTAAKP